MRLWDPGAKAERALARSHDEMVAKLRDSGAINSFTTRLHNEVASARGGHSGGKRMSGNQDVSAWVSEGLESSRPAGRSRRSPDPDRQGYAPGGIFGARRPDVRGNIPYERWPERTQPAFYQPPVTGPAASRGGGCQCGYC